MLSTLPSDLHFLGVSSHRFLQLRSSRLFSSPSISFKCGHQILDIGQAELLEGGCLAVLNKEFEALIEFFVPIEIHDCVEFFLQLFVLMNQQPSPL